MLSNMCEQNKDPFFKDEIYDAFLNLDTKSTRPLTVEKQPNFGSITAERQSDFEFCIAERQSNFESLTEMPSFFNLEEEIAVIPHENLKKKRGRKKKNSEEVGKHNKYTRDNCNRKIISHFNKFLVDFINKALDTFCGKNQEKFCKIKFEKILKKERLKSFLQKSISDFLKEKINNRYNREENFNKNLVEKIMRSEEKKFYLIKRCLSLSFIDFYENIFLKKNNVLSKKADSIFDNISSFSERVNNNPKEKDDKYKEHLIDRGNKLPSEIKKMNGQSP